jgi:hypothetical protein
MTIPTVVGDARVLHRLALAVECIDAVTRDLVTTSVRIGAEVAPRLRTNPGDSAWPCADFAAHGPARAILLHRPPMPLTVTVRIADLTRRFVTRRLTTALHSDADVTASDSGTGPYIPVGSRRLRVWLSPGSAYPLARATTGIRGRVVQGTTPVRWPRITALGPGNQAVGWAHGDERGEFVLVIVSTGTVAPPAPDTLVVALTVTAPAVAATPGTDPSSDLVVEDVPPSHVPTQPGDLDNPLLRGRATPPGYVASTVPTTLTIPVGAMTTLTADVPFAS